MSATKLEITGIDNDVRYFATQTDVDPTRGTLTVTDAEGYSAEFILVHSNTWADVDTYEEYEILLADEAEWAAAHPQA